MLKVGFLGIPNSMGLWDDMWRSVPWTRENLLKLKALGFDTIQLNVAWGARPQDEPLNLEDVVALTEVENERFPQTVALRSMPEPERFAARRAELQRRSQLCRELGLRTIFHFGMPYNAHGRYGDTPPNCIMEEGTVRRYELLIGRLAREYPLVNDILVYTYDQDAWLCGEFGKCPRCAGVPLHKRLPTFLNRAIGAWVGERPEGRLWWEPWELSAGQVYECLLGLDIGGLGLALHSNIAEVMVALPVDRWLKNTCAIAKRKGIPVLVEHFLGGPSEELEPFLHLSHPLATLRGLRAISALPGPVGVKEYYGLAPDQEDPNLRMTGLFFADASIGDEEALQQLAEPYAPSCQQMVDFWKMTSAGMEFFPWDSSWFMREIGRSRVDHALSAAVLRGMFCPTPSWESSRASIFMVCWSEGNRPWMLEDIQLRCDMATRHWDIAEGIAHGLLGQVGAMEDALQLNLLDLGRLRRRAVSYANHLRETNLATVARANTEDAPDVSARALEELLSLMIADRANYEAERQSGPDSPTGEPMPEWTEMDAAIDLLVSDPGSFLITYLTEAPDTQSKGMFSLTSR